MEDLSVYKDLFADKRKLVNLLQYIIEKNNYFIVYDSPAIHGHRY
jgi:hypothetical protein